MTVWRTERRYGDGADPDRRRADPDPWNTGPEPWHAAAEPWYEDGPPRRRRSPRERFDPPVPVSPPVSLPLPAVRRIPQPPVMLPPPPVQRGPGRRRAPRDRYDWRVTKHAARAVEVVDDERHFLATFGWTAAWFAVPYALFAAWTLTFPSSPGTACARPTGGACPSPRSAALTTLLDSIPRVSIALGIALVIAGLIRWGSTAWRPMTTAFSAAVIGSGTATVLYSVLHSTG